MYFIYIYLFCFIESSGVGILCKCEGQSTNTSICIYTLYDESKLFQTNSYIFVFCFKESQDGWSHALQRLHETGANAGPQEVKFFCLDVIRHMVSSGRYQQFPDNDRTLLRTSLLVFIRDIASQHAQESHIKNLLCSVLISILKHDYPERHPSFFEDFMSMLSQSPEVIDIFFRLLNTFHQDVVEYDRTRASPSEIKHNMVYVFTSLYTYTHTYTHPVVLLQPSVCMYVGVLSIDLMFVCLYVSVCLGDEGCSP